LAEASAQKHRPPERCAAKHCNRRARKYSEGDKRRNRIPRQAEEKLTSGAPEYRGFPRPQRHALEIELGAELRQHLLHQVVLARRHTAAQEQQVLFEPRLDQLSQPPNLIRCDAKLVRDTAGGSYLASQRDRVAVPNLEPLRV